MATATDDFNRANEATLTGNWETLGTAGLRLQTNQLDVGTSSVNAFSGWKTSVNDFTDEQFSQVAIKSPANSDDGGVGVRFTNTGNGTGYLAVWWQSAGQVRLYKVTSGTFTEVATRTTTWTSGDILKISVETNGANADIKVYKNDVQLGATYSDTSSVLTGGQPSLYYRWDNTRATKLDDWAGGDGTGLGGGGAASPGLPWQNKGAMGTMVAM